MPEGDQTPIPDDQTQPPDSPPSDQDINSGSPPKPPGFDSAPAQPVGEVVGQAAPSFDLQGPTTPQETKQYLQKQTTDWANDLVNQHITPLTYNKLFENDQTPGKLATIFGLMAGGMSAGLTGGPNPYLQMMDKTIQNDLAAQVQSKNNAQNFLKLNEQHQFNQYSEKSQGANADYTSAQAKNISYGLSLKQMNVVKLHTAVQGVQAAQQAAAADPNNPQKQANLQSAQQALGMVASQVDTQNAQIDDLISARTGLINAAHPDAAAATQQGVQPNPQGVDMNKVQNIIQNGKIAPNTPGFVDPAEAGQLKKEAGQILQNREVLNNYKDTFRNLANNKIKNLNQPDYDALTDLVSKQWASQLGMGEQAAKELKGNIFPSLVKDWGPTAEDKFKQGQKHFQFLESNTPEIQAFAKQNPGLYSPIQIEPINPKQQAQVNASAPSGPKEGDTGKTSKGVSVVFKNGIWVPK